MLVLVNLFKLKFKQYNEHEFFFCLVINIIFQLSFRYHYHNHLIVTQALCTLKEFDLYVGNCALEYLWLKYNHAYDREI